MLLSTKLLVACLLAAALGSAYADNNRDDQLLDPSILPNEKDDPELMKFVENVPEMLEKTVDQLKTQVKSIPTHEDKAKTVRILPTDKGISKFTHEWQEIGDEPIPAGLHVRINLTTGKKEAKLDDDTKDDDKLRAVIVQQPHGDEDKKDKPIEIDAAMIKEAISKKKLKEKMAQIEYPEMHETNATRDEEIKSQYKPIADIVKDLKDIKLKAESPEQVITQLIKEYPEAKEERKLQILKELENLVHQIDAAQHFVDINGYSTILPGFNSTNEQIRAEVANVIGSAVSSNFKVQKIVFENTEMLDMLIRHVVHDNSNKVKSIMLFAISRLISQYPFAQKRFVQFGGVKVLDKIIEDPKETTKLKFKAITLITDMLFELHSLRSDAKSDASLANNLAAYEQIQLEKSLQKTSICNSMIHLMDKDFDRQEKLIDAFETMYDLCYLDLKNNLDKLEDMRSSLKDLAKKEEGDPDPIYKPVYEKIDAIVNKLKGISYMLL